jgi:penicillin-binding protein-related factor A (putative recombinase)
MIPTKLTGRGFEKLISKEAARLLALGWADIGKYGVQCTHLGDKVIPMASLPDYEGVMNGLPKQVIFDAKVCSQASFPLNPYTEKKNKAKQIRHMRKRSRFGCTCGLMMHWNERVLKTRTDRPVTWWFPVDDGVFWRKFDSGEKKSITREDCAEYGFRVYWHKPGRTKTVVPDIWGLFDLWRNDDYTI